MGVYTIRTDAGGSPTWGRGNRYSPSQSLSGRRGGRSGISNRFSPVAGESSRRKSGSRGPGIRGWGEWGEEGKVN